MKTPHKHAELIKQWADGAEIEYRNLYDQWIGLYKPDFSGDGEYRIKPEPKPDLIYYGTHGSVGGLTLMCSISKVNCEPTDTFKLTFNGETGKLIKAEVI